MSKTIKKEVLNQLGNNFVVQNIISESGLNSKKIVLGLTIPKVFYDPNSSHRYIRFINYDKLCSVKAHITKDAIKLNFDKELISQRIASKEMSMRFHIEQIILDKVHPHLIELPLVKNQFRPFYVILHTVFNEGRFTESDIHDFPANKRAKIAKYLEFLVDIEILRKSSKGYIRGNIPIKIEEELKKKNELGVLSKTFGFIIKNHRKYVEDQLQLRILSPHIKALATYYYVSKNIGKPIKATPGYIREECSKYYGKQIPSGKFSTYMEDLHKAGILFKEGSAYYGDKKLVAKV